MKKIIAFYSFLLLTVVAFAADSTGRVLLDKIDAIVNDQIILSSDIENQLDLLNLRGEDEKESRYRRCWYGWIVSYEKLT